METVIGVFVGLIILVFLVTVHELGRAIAARRNGVVVKEFGIGFPPMAWSKKLKNGVLFTLNWLPLGGFVKMKGEHDSADKPGDYGAASFWQKTKILLAGVTINWLIAAILLSILSLTGLPKILPNQFSIANDTAIIQQPVQIAAVTPDSPAGDAGLQKGDILLRFAGEKITTSEAFRSQTKENAGKTVEVVYQRSGEEKTAEVTLRTASSESEKAGYLGVGTGQQELIKATWSAPLVGIVTTGQFTIVTLQGIGDLIANLANGITSQVSGNQAAREQGDKDLQAAGDSVAGPIGILGVIFPRAQQAGLTQLLFLTAIISLTLAVMNVLPIPALDGGRWFTMAIFRLIKKPLTKDIEERIQATGFLILMTLVVVITVADVRKFF